MVDYASRLAALESEQARLSQEEIKLTALRREEIGRLAEKLGVLEADDATLAGLMVELKSAMGTNSPQLAKWRDAGASFRGVRAARHRAEALPSADRRDKV
jgi:hypothetical protein